MAAPQPLSDQFSDSYSRRGLQPSVGYAAPRNVRIEKRDPHKRQGGFARDTSTRAVKTTVGTSAQVAGIGLQGTAKVGKMASRAGVRAGAALSETGVGAVVGAPLAAGSAAVGAVSSGADAAGKQMRRAGKSLKKKKRAKKNTIKSIALTPLNISTISWTMFVWFAVQLPFAVLSTIAFAVAYLFHEVTGGKDPAVDKEGNILDGFFSFAWKGVKIAAKGLNDAIDKLTGFNIADFISMLDPTNFFIVLQTVVYVIGMVMLLCIIFTYLFSFCKVASGRAAGLKQGMLILAVVGYAGAYVMPLLGFFPWFLPYIIVMWLNPK